MSTSRTNSSDYDECGSYTGPPDRVSDHRHDIDCNAIGRYLRIQRNNGRFLTICEVIVNGYVYNGVEGNIYFVLYETDS